MREASGVCRQKTATTVTVSANHNLGTSVVFKADPAPGLFEPGKTRTIELEPIDPGHSWTEMVPSWNLEEPQNAALTVEARVLREGSATKWYSFGTWNLGAWMGDRGSVKGQRDEDGDVLTDTLRLTSPGGMVQIRLTGRAWPVGPAPRIKLLTLSFADTTADEVHFPVDRSVLGKTLEPPRYAQGDYPRGKVLCSPTCTSMVLGYWAARLNRPELDMRVPELERRVWDPVYNGAGNWSYNVAVAGALPGMQAYVARLSGVHELEQWIASGVPVVCSVSWYLLHGQEIKKDELGHLVVLVGFNAKGDPVLNDPGKRGEVRKTYDRGDFEKAWNYSKRTVYLIHPSGWPTPGTSAQKNRP